MFPCCLFSRSFTFRTTPPLTGRLRGTMWRRVTCTHLTAHCSPSPTVRTHNTLCSVTINRRLQKHADVKQAARNVFVITASIRFWKSLCNTFEHKADGTQVWTQEELKSDIINWEKKHYFLDYGMFLCDDKKKWRFFSVGISLKVALWMTPHPPDLVTPVVFPLPCSGAECVRSPPQHHAERKGRQRTVRAHPGRRQLHQVYQHRTGNTHTNNMFISRRKHYNLMYFHRYLNHN